MHRDLPSNNLSRLIIVVVILGGGVVACVVILVDFVLDVDVPITHPWLFLVSNLPTQSTSV